MTDLTGSSFGTQHRLTPFPLIKQLLKHLILAAFITARVRCRYHQPGKRISESLLPGIHLPGEDTCLHHLLPSVAVCPQGCCPIAEGIIRSGEATTEIDRQPLRQFLRAILIFAFTNLPRSNEPMAASRSSDPCRGPNSHAISNIVEMHTLQGDENPGASTGHTPQLPTATSDHSDESNPPSTATSHKRKPEKRNCIPPCYLLIFLGLLTVVGSLLPGLWRASSHNDLSGGFSLAQYILGVGIFVVGSMVAIHSKSCECWKTHNPVVS